MIDLFKSKRSASVLGMALDGNRLEAVVLRRSNGTVQVRQSVVAQLALSPLTDAPELVGREIRNHLDQAGISQRRVAVCLPLGWVLTLQTKVPDLSDADRASFLQLEGERGFHSGPESLFSAASLFTTPGGETFATLLAVPRNHLATLERVLRAAKLKPVTFAIGATALQPPAADKDRVIALAVRTTGVDLQVSGGGGIIALRSLDSAIESHGAQKRISSDLIAREIRITLGQLPGGIADGPGKIRIFGQGEMTRQFVNDISPRLAAMGLKTEAVELVSNANFDKPLPSEIAVSPAVALAAAWVRGADSNPDFLPPRIQPWQQMLSSGMSKKRLVWAAEAAAAAVVCIALAFAWQQWEIATLTSKWKAMEPRVTALTADQDQIKKFRNFYDKTFRDLRILKLLTDAFPDDGAVSAKTINVHDLARVTCTGVARDNDSYVRVFSKLSDETNEISQVHNEVRGQKPMQFSLEFQFGDEVENGN
ncbi:MAG TPA: hypothetical protein VMR33_02475 [Candidatus Baltobacteraceae bacterium]|jgi:hypothetical protein|nr:hypothetical protein [Candidatus Baltobacteraceae bacterium]